MPMGPAAVGADGWPAALSAAENACAPYVAASTQ